MERSFGADDWKSFAAEIAFPQPDEFYYFEQGDNKGLSSDEVDRDYLASKSTTARLRGKLAQSPAYQLGRLVHSQVFEHGSPGFKLGKGIYSIIEKSSGASKLAHAAEQASKVPLYGCRDCGDCSLPDIAYLMPGVAVREEPAKRPVRRHQGGQMRGPGQGLHLAQGLRPAEAARPGTAHAGAPDSLSGHGVERHVGLGEYVSWPRPPRRAFVRIG